MTATAGSIAGNWGRAAASLLVAVLVLHGCGSSTPDPTTVAMTITASSTINPNTDSQPSPVVIRIYQLKADSIFKAAEFPDLFYDAQKTLGGDMLGFKEYNVKPGETRDYNDTISGESRFLGVVAGFRDLDNATWRVIEPVEAEDDNEFNLKIDSLSIALQAPSGGFLGIF